MIKQCARCPNTINNKRKHCEQCKIIVRREGQKIYRIKNPEKIKKGKQKCYNARKEYYIEKSKLQAQNNKEHRRKYSKQYRNENQKHRSVIINANIPGICARCGITEEQYFTAYRKQLSVHHLNFNHDDDRMENLRWLCEPCHQHIHNPVGIDSEAENDFFVELNHEQLFLLYISQKKTIIQIAKEYNISCATVLNYLNKYSIFHSCEICKVILPRRTKSNLCFTHYQQRYHATHKTR